MRSFHIAAESPKCHFQPAAGQFAASAGLVLSAFVFLSLSGFILRAAIPSGSTCYVPAGGQYTRSTIQGAVDDANCGTVRIAAGTYVEHLKIKRDVSIVGAGAESTIIDGRNTDSIFVIDSGNVTIDGLTITHGQAYTASGGIHARSGVNLKLLNSIISNNKSINAPSGGSYGGGLLFEGATATVQDSMFLNNSAERAGGAIYLTGQNLNLIRTTVSNNNAGTGGGIDIESNFSTVNIENSTITNNNWIAIKMDAGNIYISSSTIANNLGGGIAMNKSNAETYLKSTILSNNGTNCHIVYTKPDNGVSNLGNNLRWPASDGSCVGTVADPKLGALTNNGGLPETMLPLSGSPAIHNGSCTNAGGKALPVDERLYIRSSSGCDIGAAQYGAVVSAALPEAAWWTLDEDGSEYTAHDLSSHRDNGAVHTYFGIGPPWSPNHTDTVFYDRGSLYTGAGAWVSAPVATNSTDNVSLVVWLNCAGCSTYPNSMVPVYNGNSGADGFGLYIDHSNMHVELLLGNVLFHDFKYTLPTTYTWTHLALVRLNGLWRLYVNGSDVGNTQNKAPGVPTGTTTIGADTVGGNQFGGFIDDVRIYNRPLLPAEIQWLATADH